MTLHYIIQPHPSGSIDRLWAALLFIIFFLPKSVEYFLHWDHDAKDVTRKSLNAGSVSKYFYIDSLIKDPVIAAVDIPTLNK